MRSLGLRGKYIRTRSCFVPVPRTLKGSGIFVTSKKPESLNYRVQIICCRLRTAKARAAIIITAKTQ